MYTTYTIGELAKILGVTAETIRYYERKNIIQPIHDENSGYRYYTAWDLHMLIRARCYLGFGFNIEQVKEILQKESIEKIDDLLSKQEEIIQENIIYQMNILKKLKANRSLINDAKKQDHQLTLKMRPGIYRIDSQKCYNLFLSKKEQEALKQFCQKVPFIFLLHYFLKKTLKNKILIFILELALKKNLRSFLILKKQNMLNIIPHVNVYICVFHHVRANF